MVCLRETGSDINVMVDVKVPVLAESVAEATLLEWRKQPGDAVSQDEILIEIETDKVVLEVPAPQSGVLKEVLKQSGDSVVSDELIARVDADGVPAEESVQPSSAEPARSAKVVSLETETRLSPAVRKLVEEHELDPSAIPATGRDGRLTKGDVLEYLERGEQAAAPIEPAPKIPEAASPTPATEPAVSSSFRGERRVSMTRIRARIAERLVAAQHTAAILTTFNEINMQPVLELRRRYREAFEKKHGVRLGIMSFFAKAVVLALRRFPVVNASIDGDEIVYHDYYDIGIAVGSERGLVVPILRDVEQLSFSEIEARITDFGQRASSGQLGVEELTGGTFTITNGGVFGSLLSTPILNPPQSAILGMHKTQERPVVDNGDMVIRPMMYVALSYDHRLVDGREAVQFLVTVKEGLEDPGRMLLEV
jgi:2-oxoglutarate dehydrogenase E2 component (dihydrolipoamide succinyltransferase)